jgi:uncharacterized protein YcaQ
MERHPESAARLLERVRERGPVRSSDFERLEKGGTWWDWKPEKRMLYSLFPAAALMSRRRDRFQRIYDLRERVLPSWSDDQLPSAPDVDRALALKAVRALGIAKARWVADYYRTSKTATKLLPARLARSGELHAVAVEGWKEPGYVHPDHLPAACAAAEGRLKPTLTTLLSPFDPLVWDRVRASDLFGFDYRLECYTPAPRRVYGYYVLPILRRGRLIGRLDAKAHRKEGIVAVRALYLEPGVRLTDRAVADVANAIQDCARWHGTPAVSITRSDPPQVAHQIAACLDAARVAASRDA